MVRRSWCKRKVDGTLGWTGHLWITLFFLYYFRKYKMSFFIFLKMIVSSFLLKTSFEKMSLFVSLILYGHSGKHCRSPLLRRDRSRCNSYFSRSGSLLSRPIPSPSILTSISCSLNCYLVEKMTGSLQWGVIYENERFNIVLIKRDPNLNKSRYLVNSYLNVLYDQISRVYKSDRIFIQDNVLIHTVKKVKK